MFFFSILYHHCYHQLHASPICSLQYGPQGVAFALCLGGFQLLCYPLKRWPIEWVLFSSTAIRISSGQLLSLICNWRSQWFATHHAGPWDVEAVEIMGEVEGLGPKIPESCCRITGTEEDFYHEDGAKPGLFHRCLTFTHTQAPMQMFTRSLPQSIET